MGGWLRGIAELALPDGAARKPPARVPHRWAERREAPIPSVERVGNKQLCDVGLGQTHRFKIEGTPHDGE